VTQAAEAAGDPDPGLESLLGIHLEGPWISPQALGAHASGAVRPIEAREVAEVLDCGGGALRMVTFAPELPGAPGLQEELARRGVVGALGHSMTQPDDAERVIASGARHVTHLYNAMTQLHHRAPGLPGLALSDPRLTCDLICDGVHVDPRVVRFSARALGERLLLISDRVEPAPGDAFGSGALRDDGEAWRLPDGRLAGSRLTLERAAANLREFAGASPWEAIAACTLRPARLLGLEAERGTLRPGARADLVVLGPDGAVRETWLRGRRVHPD
jgi:N-acetylglucosamine-6-phosphate deacetylase